MSLNKATFDSIGELFVQIFEQVYIFKTIGENHKARLDEWLVEVITEHSLYRLPIPGANQALTRQIASDPVIREFVFELTERLSLELFAYGEDTWEDLIDMLAQSSYACKSRVVKEEDKSNVEVEQEFRYALVSITVKEEDIRSQYLDYPWLVIVALLLLRFSQTQVAMPLNVNYRKALAQLSQS